MQGLTSDTCGDYCLFYLFHRVRNIDLNTIQGKFRRHDSQWNDAQVAQFVHSYVKTVSNVRNKTFLQNEQQDCISFHCWRKQSIKYL